MGVYMDNMLLHPLTRQNLEQALDGNHHALALVGPYGSGKFFIAHHLANQLLGKDRTEYRILHVTTDSQSIGIERIRELQSFLKLKATGKGEVKRVIIIENAELLTTEAQNALLKTLEEPPSDTRLILTTPTPSALRKTVYSRLQPIHIKPCSLEQAMHYFRSTLYNYDDAAIEKAYLISGGYVGLCASLLEDEEHDVALAIKEAKEFLLSGKYERLRNVDGLARDKHRVLILLFAIKRVLSAAAKNTKQDSSLNSLGAKLKLVHEAEKAMSLNPNVKLLLTDLAVNL